jgi:lipopolysaccharide transport system permease protein
VALPRTTVFLAWRDVKVRYKQTALGVAWAVLQSLLGMVVFTIFFGRLAKVPSDGIPYPLFSYSALLAWQLFAFSPTESSNSVLANERLITKVYFPRLVIPIASPVPGHIVESGSDKSIGLHLLPQAKYQVLLPMALQLA